MKYVVFLRGINIGSKKKVPMEDLRQLFEGMGYSEVRTILNSGNVIFKSGKEDEEVLQDKIENALEKRFGFEVRVVIRTRDEVQNLLKIDPFKDIEITKDTRLYITFLSEGISLTRDSVQEMAGECVRVVRFTNREICSAIMITPDKNTVDLMGFLEKLFGQNITTRNWNTIFKIMNVSDN